MHKASNIFSYVWRSPGSHHKMPVNAALRKHMLEAVSNPSCINPPDSTCTLCGLLFSPRWTHLLPGNFWTAPCSYINKLLPPVEFKHKMQRLQKYVMRLENDEALQTIVSKIWTSGDKSWLSGKSMIKIVKCGLLANLLS